jgi:large repetitive protein
MRFTRVSIFVALLALVIVPIAAAFAFTDASFNTPTGVTGQSYSHRFEIREGGGCPPYEYRINAGALPTGLSLTPDGKQGGTVSGTPTVAGAYSFWVVAKDTPAACGFPATPPASTERQFTIKVIPGLNILQNALNPRIAFTGEAYSFQLTAEGGGSQTWSVNSGAPPAGISVNSSGLVSGTPTATGDFTFQVRVTDGSRSDVETYSMSVVDRLKLTAAPSPRAEVGLPATLKPTATGGRPGYTWSLEGSLPAGLVMDGATGVITGKPTIAGTYALKLSVRDVLGLSQTADINLVVMPRLAIAKGLLKGAKVGSSYKARFRSTGGVAPRLWILLGGRPGLLPPGIKLNRRTGELSGTPTKAGTYRLRIQVVDKLGAKSAAGFVLKVAG